MHSVFLTRLQAGPFTMCVTCVSLLQGMVPHHMLQLYRTCRVQFLTMCYISVTPPATVCYSCVSPAATVCYTCVTLLCPLRYICVMAPITMCLICVTPSFCLLCDICVTAAGGGCRRWRPWRWGGRWWSQTSRAPPSFSPRPTATRCPYRPSTPKGLRVIRHPFHYHA